MIFKVGFHTKIQLHSLSFKLSIVHIEEGWKVIMFNSWVADLIGDDVLYYRTHGGNSFRESIHPELDEPAIITSISGLS